MKIELPADLRDETRGVRWKMPRVFLSKLNRDVAATGQIPGAPGIVELKEGGVVPVTLRNVEAKLPVANLRMPAEGAHRFSGKRLTDDAEVIAAIKALDKFEQQTRTVKVGEGKEQYESEDPFYARELSFLKGKAGSASRELPKPGGAEFGSS